jgi:hypothetical protein
MEQNLLDRLTALVETYKQQKFKLSKSEGEEAATLLTQAFLASLGPAFDRLDNFIRSLPADSTAKALRDSWDNLADQTRSHLYKSLLELPRTDRFDRLKLLAAAAIGDADSQRGLSFLCTACASLESRPGGHVNSEVLQAFRKTFLDGPSPLLEKWNINSHPSAVTAGLLNIVVQSLFHHSAQSSASIPDFQISTVKWLFRSHAYNRLKPAHQTQLIEAIKKWNSPLQLEVRNALESLSLTLPVGFEFLLAPPATKETQSPPQSPPVPAEPAPVQSETLRLSWKDHLAELHKHITKLDENLATAGAQAEEKQAENRKLKTSLETATLHIQNLKDELVKKAEENEKAAIGLATAQNSCAVAIHRAEELQTQINDLKRKQEDEIRILMSRVETEAAQRVESFKHSLARVLRVDYADFKINEGKPMTVELGQGLHHLLDSIFEALQKQGVSAKG